MKSVELTQSPDRESSVEASRELAARELGGLGLQAIAHLHPRHQDEFGSLPRETGGRAAERVAQIRNRQAWESNRIENIARRGGYAIVVDTGETIIRG